MTDSTTTTTGASPFPSYPSVSPSVQLHEVLAASRDLQEFLEEFTQIMAAHLSSSGVEVWCAVTLLRDGTAGTVASSNARAVVLDEIQYGFDKGPCMSAARQQLLIHAPDFATDDRWGAYTEAAMAQGVHSAVAAPFDLPGPDQAALNVYAGVAHAFDETAIATITQEVAATSTALRLALRLAHYQDTEADLRAAMDSRTAIDVAVGIVMAQHYCTQEEAFALLAAAASTRHTKVREIATQLVETTGGQAPTTHFNTSRSSTRTQP